MSLKFGNFATAKLATPPSGTGGLSFTVAAGKGALFPVLSAGDWCYMVLRNASLVREVVKVEARTTDAFTIATGGRGADGSSAYASWAANDVVEICLTNAALLDALADAGRWVAAGGTADAITANYTPDIYALVDGQLCFVRAGSANATATPTFSPDGLTARTIVQYGGAALEVGSIRGAGHELILRYNLANTRWELLNPEIGIHRATTKATPVDADEFGFWDSVSGALRKLTFANLKTIFALVGGSASQAFAASIFTGNLTGNVTGNTSGSSGSCTGNTSGSSGSCTGNTSGSSGSCTGNAATATNATNATTSTTQAVGTNTTAIATTAFCEEGFVNNDVTALGIGCILGAIKTASGSVASGATIAGSGLWDGGGTTLTSGTWRNIGPSSATTTYYFTFQRIS